MTYNKENNEVNIIALTLTITTKQRKSSQVLTPRETPNLVCDSAELVGLCRVIFWKTPIPAGACQGIVINYGHGIVIDYGHG